MAFPILGAIGAVTGLAGSLFGGMQQRAAASQANKLAEKQAQQQYERAVKEWNIDFWEKMANWQWDVAKVEAAKYLERQKESDYAWRSARLIDSAMQNMEVNTGALFDKFVTEENLRAYQVGQDLGYKIDQLSANAGETVRQYMASIRDKALQTTQTVNQMEREQQEIMSSMSFEMQKDNLGWTINQIASVVESAQAKATADARLGGSSTSERIAINAAQALGRTWGEMSQRAKSREARIGLMNTAMRGETATQLARTALAMQDEAEKIKFTGARYAADTKYELDRFANLTIPSFQLAENQYGRELRSLQIQTQSVIDEASMPYRKAIIFDPVAPIKGLAPEKYAPTKVYVPSMGGILGSAILGGFQGAINLGTYTNPNGTLGWR